MKTYLRVLEVIEAAGTRAWLVGDPVREVASGIQPLTLSVVVERCDLEALAASLGNGTVEGEASFPVLRTTILGSRVDITCMRGDSIEEDLTRRDFSMNAMAIRNDDVFVDPWGGRHDIRNRVIRLTGDDIDLVQSDPIRIIRMLRFSAELDMAVFWKSETDVRHFIRTTPERIRNMPAERWGREILNGMRRCPHDFICLCDHYQLLPFFLDDIESLKKIPSRNGQSLFEHTLEMVRLVQNFLSGRKRRPTDVALSLAALFRHAGSKPDRLLEMENAADTTARLLKSWNINSEVVNMVSVLLRNASIPCAPATEEQLCREVLTHGPEAMEMLIDFAICSAQADGTGETETLISNKWRLSEVLRRFDDVRRHTGGSTRYLTGGEVMKILAIQPGRVVGEILNALDIAVGTGGVVSKKEATDWVTRRGSVK
jgi:tRNA nucleotidyltransferase/poly(A) polymerase